MVLANEIDEGQAGKERAVGFADCFKSSGAKKEDLLASKQTPEVRCFIKCVAEKKGIIKYDGTLSLELVEKQIRAHSPNATEEFIDGMKNCLGKVKITKCDDLVYFKKCTAIATDSLGPSGICLKETGLQREDLVSKPSKKITKLMCYMKCLGEKKGYVDRDGRINLELVEREIRIKSPNASDKFVDGMKRCLENVKIKTCDDVAYYTKCASKVAESTGGYSECVKSSRIQKEDLLSRLPKQTTEVMCFMKCMGEKRGSINQDGSLNLEIIEKRMRARTPKISDEFVDEMMKCLTSVKIVTCQDMSNFRRCGAVAFVATKTSL